MHWVGSALRALIGIDLVIITGLGVDTERCLGCV